MPSNLKLSKDDCSLLYITASRPDIAFSVGVCARYQACPKESYLIALKHIIRKYLVAWLSKKQNSVSLSTTEVEYIAVVVVVLNFYESNKC
ncbi:hypothetical protein CK203_061055 [Vitis vinifera]|uniref:Uncharacterized protein n=1 Tax=Vitis vinifera TaxID=29760 RepID=A0A438GLF6_VITVI|nr:hypothetical protein CK203_061055 [Vitis vinifera]